MLERDTVHISFTDISRKSGVNAPLIRYYFGNKSDMLLALVRRVVGGSIGQMNDLVDLPLQPKEKLRLHIGGIINTYYRHPYINSPLNYLLSVEGDLYGPILADEVITPMVEVQKRIIDQGVAAGVFRPIDPMFFYMHVAGACDNLSGRAARSDTPSA
ncbi:MAG TPA: hypothetical protein VKS60_15200 [Stellaceae bacterium]|nr:hypothetical protein [Stellaceae bacterium]